MNTDAPSQLPISSERATRTNLMLSGLVVSGTGEVPVRIRNLSESGALIEGPGLPGPGAKLTLRRMEMETRGTVVWGGDSRCGIKFDVVISVADWRRGTCIRRGVHRDQARADDIQARIRSGNLPTSGAGPAEGRASEDELNARLVQELTQIAALLEQMGDELSDEVAVVEHHSHALQNFDRAGQIIRHVATILAADDRAAAAAAIGMEELRERLLNKSQGKS